MRIVLIHFNKSPNPDYTNTVSSLRRKGHQVWLGQVNSDGIFEMVDGSGVVKTISRTQRGKKSFISPLTDRLHTWQFFKLIRMFLRSVDPDIVQVNPVTLCWLIPIGMPRSIKFIFDVKQINMGVKPTLGSRLKDWSLGASWWFTGRFIYDYACFDYPLAAKRLFGQDWARWATSIPVGIDTAMLEAPSDPYNLSPSQPVRLVYIGAINRFRELELLFYAIQRVAASTDQFRVDFIGPDKADGFYQALVRELGIDHVVTIKAPIHYSQVPQVLQQYHVGLAYNPARPTWDFQPTIKILEYRAIGLPIISTNVRAHHDFVIDGENGYLVNNSANEWADAILRLVEDRTLLKSTQENSQKMRRGVTHEEVAQMHEQVYRQLIAPEALSSSLGS
jgi:glycosyltransferase involved in cell wall biosynthesis